MQFITLEIDFSKKYVSIFRRSDCMLVVLGEEKKKESNQMKRINLIQGYSQG